MRKPKVVGFLVVDSCEEWALPLRLVHDEGMPESGILSWQDTSRDAVSLFQTRASARAAIQRTHHWGLAVGAPGMWPSRLGCKVVPVRVVPA